MKYRKLLIALACTGFLFSYATSCSNSEEPAETQQNTVGDSNPAHLNTVGKLVNGEMNGTLKSRSFKEYQRKIGSSEWREFNPLGDGITTPILVGYTVGIDFPKPIVFLDSDCLLEFIPNVLDPAHSFHLLRQYWEAYCQKTNQDYRLYIRIPYEYQSQSNSLKLGRIPYTVEAESPEEIQLGYYSTENDREFKRVCTYTLASSPDISSELMLAYDTPEQLHDDVIRRLKEAFGEEGDISALWPTHPNIKFEELEKEMAEMAYDFLYWSAPKPAWY